MKNRIIRIVMLTALIALTLTGMTSPLTVLGGSKPLYSVTVQVQCSGYPGIVESYTKATAAVTFWGGSKSQDNLGSIDVSCEGDQVSDATATLQSSQEPNRWGAHLTIRDYVSDDFVCDTWETSTTFPANLRMNCYSPYEPWWPNPVPPGPPPYVHGGILLISTPTH